VGVVVTVAHIVLIGQMGGGVAIRHNDLLAFRQRSRKAGPLTFAAACHSVGRIGATVVAAFARDSQPQTESFAEPRIL